MLNRILLYAVIFSFFVSFCYAQQQESVTITTYYPSPFGSYRELHADQMTVGSAYRVTTAPNNGLIIEGNVGIGTAQPTALLDVNGAIRIRGGNPAEDRVLTSDAMGNARWATLPITVYVRTGATSARCSAGDIAIGGGCTCEQMTDNADFDKKEGFSSKPWPTQNIPPSEWRCSCQSGSDHPWSVTTYVVCLKR